MDYLAGIDLGSTSLKCVIYDLNGNVVCQRAAGRRNDTILIPITRNGQYGSRSKSGAELRLL